MYKCTADAVRSPAWYTGTTFNRIKNPTFVIVIDNLLRKVKWHWKFLSTLIKTFLEDSLGCRYGQESTSNGVIITYAKGAYPTNNRHNSQLCQIEDVFLDMIPRESDAVMIYLKSNFSQYDVENSRGLSHYVNMYPDVMIMIRLVQSIHLH